MGSQRIFQSHGIGQVFALDLLRQSVNHALGDRDSEIRRNQQRLDRVQQRLVNDLRTQKKRRHLL